MNLACMIDKATGVYIPPFHRLYKIGVFKCIYMMMSTNSCQQPCQLIKNMKLVANERCAPKNIHDHVDKSLAPCVLYPWMRGDELDHRQSLNHPFKQVDDESKSDGDDVRRLRCFQWKQNVVHAKVFRIQNEGR